MEKPRALVTRPRSEARGVAALLAARGIEPIVEPMMEIVDRGAAPDVARVQAILCTSANGVRALARASGERGVPVFAVGDATARAARDAGFVAVESAAGDVDDLARFAAARLDPARGGLLHVAGSEVAGDLAGRLAAGGFAVQRAVLYEARAVAALSAATVRLIEGGDIDLALFFSPRTGAIFARLVGAAGIGAGLRMTTAVSISAAADAALGALPFRGRAIAAMPTQEALLVAVERVAARPAEATS